VDLGPACLIRYDGFPGAEDLQLGPGPRPCATGSPAVTSCTKRNPASLVFGLPAQAWRWAANGGAAAEVGG